MTYKIISIVRNKRKEVTKEITDPKRVVSSSKNFNMEKWPSVIVECKDKNGDVEDMTMKQFIRRYKISEL